MSGTAPEVELNGKKVKFIDFSASVWYNVIIECDCPDN